MECKICGNSRDNVEHRFREVMFGMGDAFDYFECAECGTIQIKNVPNLSTYYPKDYYSFDLDSFRPRESWIRNKAISSAGKYFLDGSNPIGRLAAPLRPTLSTQFPSFLRETWMGLSLDSRILDVGCGSGGLLLTLSGFGFKHLMGADPFIENDIHYPSGPTIQKRAIEKVHGAFDLIMFHHSLEHISDPLSSLQSSHDLLDEKGLCIVRIPIVSRAWEDYGADWAQVDAPRHLTLFTENGFRGAAEKAGFSVEKVAYDSTAFQFWGSEMIRKGTPLQQAITGGDDFLRREFDGMLTEWEQAARERNAEGTGDQACFYLRRL